jgi:predicted Zn-dependent protease with MMP-like domain/Flp pilus assembly protein TadD
LTASRPGLRKPNLFMRPAAQSRGNRARDLLRRAWSAFRNGRPREVLALARRALHEAPNSAPALHFQATAQAELGHHVGAEESYRKALRLDPEDLEIILSAAHFFIIHHEDVPGLLSEGVHLCARGRALARAHGRRDLLYELSVLEAAGWNRAGRADRGLRRANEALSLFPNSVDALRERATSSFDLCDFDAAEADLVEVVRSEPGDAWAYYHLGLIEERNRSFEQAQWYFDRAHALAPEEFSLPVRLSDAEFASGIEEALGRLPQAIRPHLERVAVSVEELPSVDLLKSTRPPLPPTIVGVFRGTPVPRNAHSGGAAPAGSIVLYRRNLERSGKDVGDVRRQIAITVMHEVGHLLGLNEDELREQGLH